MNGSDKQSVTSYPDWLSPTALTKYKQLETQVPQTPRERAILAMLVDCFGDYVKAVESIRNDGLSRDTIRIKIELTKTIVSLLSKLKLKESNGVKQLLSKGD